MVFRSWSTPITGDECKIVYFCDGHPMNSPTFGDDEWEDLGLGAVEKVCTRTFVHILSPQFKQDLLTISFVMHRSY